MQATGKIGKYLKMGCFSEPSHYLLQIFCKFVFDTEVIIKNVIDPEDNFWRKLLVFSMNVQCIQKQSDN